MMDRGERRDIKERKWISRLKKTFNSGFRTIIMPIKESRWSNYHEGKTWEDLKNDKYGVMLKNTGTICSDKRLDIQEEHKRNLRNRKLTNEEQIEAQEAIEDMNDPFAFEKYCGTCDNFPGNLGEINKREYNGSVCPFRQKFIDGIYSSDTEWKRIGCEQFWD